MHLETFSERIARKAKDLPAALLFIFSMTAFIFFPIIMC